MLIYLKSPSQDLPSCETQLVTLRYQRRLCLTTKYPSSSVSDVVRPDLALVSTALWFNDVRPSTLPERLRMMTEGAAFLRLGVLIGKSVEHSVRFQLKLP